jgi:hypothetical protein|tara:strand:- start:5659 stop:5862 length:204 start_codon:yes stop_codon:yes gene_type:complete
MDNLAQDIRIFFIGDETTIEGKGFIDEDKRLIEMYENDKVTGIIPFDSIKIIKFLKPLGEGNPNLDS